MTQTGAVIDVVRSQSGAHQLLEEFKTGEALEKFKPLYEKHGSTNKAVREAYLLALVEEDSKELFVETQRILDDEEVDDAMAYLCRHTLLQTTFSVNLTCLIPTSNPEVGQPLRATLFDLCRYFLDFRFTVTTKRFEHELHELETRMHILAGLALIADQLDKVIRLIRAAASRKDARERLMKGFRLDAVQADAILDIRLYQLARLEVDKIQNERQEKEKRTTVLRSLLGSKDKRWAVIRGELQEIGKKYGDRRRTALRSGKQLSYDPEAYILHEEATVILSRDGWIKRGLPTDQFLPPDQ